MGNLFSCFGDEDKRTFAKFVREAKAPRDFAASQIYFFERRVRESTAQRDRVETEIRRVAHRDEMTARMLVRTWFRLASAVERYSKYHERFHRFQGELDVLLDDGDFYLRLKEEQRLTSRLVQKTGQNDEQEDGGRFPAAVERTEDEDASVRQKLEGILRATKTAMESYTVPETGRHLTDELLGTYLEIFKRGETPDVSTGARREVLASGALFTTDGAAGALVGHDGMTPVAVESDGEYE
jgi:hypothetical protein